MMLATEAAGGGTKRDGARARTRAHEAGQGAPRARPPRGLFPAPRPMNE